MISIVAITRLGAEATIGGVARNDDGFRGRTAALHSKMRTQGGGAEAGGGSGWIRRSSSVLVGGNRNSGDCMDVKLSTKHYVGNVER